MSKHWIKRLLPGLLAGAALLCCLAPAALAASVRINVKVLLDGALASAYTTDAATVQEAYLALAGQDAYEDTHLACVTEASTGALMQEDGTCFDPNTEANRIASRKTGRPYSKDYSTSEEWQKALADWQAQYPQKENQYRTELQKAGAQAQATMLEMLRQNGHTAELGSATAAGNYYLFELHSGSKADCAACNG